MIAGDDKYCDGILRNKSGAIFSWTNAPEFDRRLTVTAGVNNILNRDPPTCFSCSLNGFNPSTYDVPGVFGYVSAAYHVQ